jgi:6-phosphogluconate dehydrogenase
MQLGMVGLGRMGANMARRLMRDGHELVVYDVASDAVKVLEQEGARGTTSLPGLVEALAAPRAVWLMLPVAFVEDTIRTLAPLLERGDILVDGGNSHYHDDIRRARELADAGIHHVDVGTSGGVWGLERGYCQMIGGEPEAVERLDPLFRSLAPGVAAATRTPGRSGERGTAEQGYLHCGPSGAGHFVKMVHNGIEYGLMAAYAEGFNVLRHAGIGAAGRSKDAETTPLERPEHFQYRLDLIASWLLDLTATALRQSPGLERFDGRVSDSGEGRWTIQAAIETGVPVHVLSAALFDRFASRGESDFADRLLSAMRFQFGGHEEKGRED